jgi:hypothetical protein
MIILAGCGGSGNGAALTSGGGPAPSFAEVGSAKFTIDAVSGSVKVVPLSSDGRAVFGGSSVGLASSVLLSEGSPERRVLKVTLTNNTKEAIGANGSFRVLFSSFRNDNAPITDLRSTVRTMTLVGNGTAPTVYGSLASARVEAPKSIAYDPATGDIFCAATSLGVIKSGVFTRYTPMDFSAVAVGPGAKFGGTGTGIYLLSDGESAILSAGHESAVGLIDGDFATARFSDIRDIFVQACTSETDFSLLVADGDCIRKVFISPAVPGGSVSTLATEPPIGGFSGVTEKDGIIYATISHMIKIWRDPSNRAVIGQLGSGSSDGAQATARFGHPLGDLDFIDGTLYVADRGNNRIRQLSLIPGSSPMSPGAWWISTLSGGSTAGGTDGTGTMTHNQPLGICRGNGDELIVADFAGNKLRRITPISGRFSVGHGDSTSNPTELAALANPTGFAPSQPKTNPYIQEEKLVPAGAAIELNQWQFNLPEGLKAFSFVVTIEAETSAPGVLPAVSNTGTGTRGSASVLVRGFSGRPSSGNVDGALSQAAFSNIPDITSTLDGDMFVTDFNNHAIRRIGRNGQVTTIAGGTPAGGSIDGPAGTSTVFEPYGIACSPDGKFVFFTQVNHVVRMAALAEGMDPAQRASWTLYTIAGLADNSGLADSTSGTDSRFLGPTDVIYVSPTVVYVVEQYRVRIISHMAPGYASGSYFVRTLAGSPGGAVGFANGTGGSVLFNHCVRAALTPSGDLLVADNYNDRIRLVTPTGVTTTIAGSGVNGYVDNPNGMLSMFKNPISIAVEPSGYAYIFDNNNGVIRRLSPGGSVTTVAGVAATSGDLDGPGNTALFTPSAGNGLWVGAGGDLYMTHHTRVRLIQRVIGN